MNTLKHFAKSQKTLNRLGRPYNKGVKTMWDLDKIPNYAFNESRQYFAKLQNKPNSNFKVAQKIQFFTGANNDILACAKIKAIDGDDIYVYNDSYWYPIQDDEKRNIKIILDKAKGE